MKLLKNGKIKTSEFFKIVAAKIGVRDHRYVAQVYQGTKIRPLVRSSVRQAARETLAELNLAGVDVSWHQPQRY